MHCSRIQWNLSVYIGQDLGDGDLMASENVVLSLADGLLDNGRTIFLDNFYSGIHLAHYLLDRQTHCVGTFRSNRKYIPEVVKSTLLKKGEKIARESPDGITVLKWKDRRDVRVLTTQHDGTEMVEVDRRLRRAPTECDEQGELGEEDELEVQVQPGRRSARVMKPKALIDYNTGKCSVDLSDQMESYNTALRRSIYQMVPQISY